MNLLHVNILTLCKTFKNRLWFIAFLFLFFISNLSAVTTKDMIGQLLMVGFYGDEPSKIKPLLQEISQDKVGGVLLLGRNIASPKKLSELTSALQDASKTPLLIAIDQEGGKVARLNSKNGFEDFPSAKSVGENLDLKQARVIYTKMAQLLKSYGINYNLAPVVDIQNPISPIIGAKNRAFSKNPKEVSSYAKTFIDAFEKEGILTSLKHFPGHGNAKKDSHTHIVDATSSWKYEELFPYFELIQNKKAKSIMVAHIYLKQFDKNYPATLSKKIVNQILRQDLGYDGLVISDDLAMKGVSGKFNLYERLVLAINAGVDMLIISEPEIDGLLTAKLANSLILKALENGDIEKKSIQSAYKRVMDIKKELL